MSLGLTMSKLLAEGRGVSEMLDVCKEFGYTRYNTTLEVDDTSDLNSPWRIYEMEEE